MKPITLTMLLLSIFLVACGSSQSGIVPVAELPDPAIYALTISELPVVGLNWQQTYNQTTANEGYKWSYLAYQAYQAGTPGVELESAFAVNNDIVLYEDDMSRAELPQPPSALGNIQNITWKSATLSQRFGNKSAVWKTTIGELVTPVWWMEFYQGHAYVRISLLGFPDQLAPAVLTELGEFVANRLPRSVATLRSDAATVVATREPVVPTVTEPTSTLDNLPIATLPATISPSDSLAVSGYSAPVGETGMVAYFDDTGFQLADGVTGSHDILADLGKGTAYEWVGWTDAIEPVTLTFSLAETTNIAAVQIGFNHREGLGVFIPESVVINGTNFNLDGEAVPNNQRGDLTFTGPFQGPTVEIVLHHRGRGWILVDEVRFLAGR